MESILVHSHVFKQSICACLLFTVQSYSFLVHVQNTAGKIGESIHLYTRAQKEDGNSNSEYVGWEYFPAQVVQIWGENNPGTTV